MVVGQIQPDEELSTNLDFSSCEMELIPANGPHGMIPATPEEFDTREKRTQWWMNWYRSETGLGFFPPVDQRGKVLDVRSNGNFAAEMVALGRYWVSGSVLRNNKKMLKLISMSTFPRSGPLGLISRPILANLFSNRHCNLGTERRIST